MGSEHGCLRICVSVYRNLPTYSYSMSDPTVAQQEVGQVATRKHYRLWLFRRWCYIKAVRWWTEPLASRIHQWTKWAAQPTREQPKYLPRWFRRWCAGLTNAAWTHVCGHDLFYSFKIGCIYWWPRYAKHALGLLEMRERGTP